MVRSVWETYFEIFADSFPKLRKSQKMMLDEYESIRDSNNIVELEAPPGTGKSLVNMIIALSEDDDYEDVSRKIVINSMTKQLQYQYLEEFGKILENHNITYAAGVGTSSFSCKYKNEGDVCIAAYGLACPYMPKIREGPLKELIEDNSTEYYLFGFNLPFAKHNDSMIVKRVDYKENMCDYWKNECLVFSSKVIFANYHYFLNHLLLRSSLPCPSVIIMDEAHRYPEIFSETCSINLSDNIMETLRNLHILDSVCEFVSSDMDYGGLSDLIEYLYSCSECIEDYARGVKGYHRLELINLVGKIRVTYTIKKFVEDNGEPLERYFIMRLPSSNTLRIIPTYFAAKASIDYLSTFTDKIILSSATLPPTRIGDYRIGTQHSVYPPENRPVIYLVDAGDITNKTISNSKTLSYIQSLISLIWSYPALRKIIIHSINNFIRDFLADWLSNLGYPVLVADQDIHKTVSEFINMDEGILIGSSLIEGVDFKYDAARVQIITKVPLTDLRKDLFLRDLSRKDKRLYNWYIAKKVVQASGRVVRSSDDIGITFILDKRAYNHFMKYSYIYPYYFRSAVKAATLAQLTYVLSYINNAISASKKTSLEKDVKSMLYSHLGRDTTEYFLKRAIRRLYKRLKNY